MYLGPTHSRGHKRKVRPREGDRSYSEQVAGTTVAGNLRVRIHRTRNPPELPAGTVPTHCLSRLRPEQGAKMPGLGRCLFKSTPYRANERGEEPTTPDASRLTATAATIRTRY